MALVDSMALVDPALSSSWSDLYAQRVAASEYSLNGEGYLLMDTTWIQREYGINIDGYRMG